ncbi:MAG: peptidylprolyl isomerase [Prevotella sp.]|nr:peptidylprolyl isomerase [Prevotella sp.]
MKKTLIAAALLLGTVRYAAALPQPHPGNDDPVIMTVAGVDVPRSEFEYSYNKNNTDGVIDKKTVEEYVDLFINYKLKVQAALDEHIDTTKAFLTEFAQYRDQQVKPTFVTDDDMLAEAHKVYDQTVENIGPQGLIRPAHILIMIPQKATDAQKQEAKQRIDSVYQAIQAGADFEELAKKVSQDPGSARNGGVLGWVGQHQLVKEFEDAAFALQPGEMSAPVESPYGWHIILMKERKMLEPFDFHRENILKFLEQRGARERISEQKLDAMVKADSTLTKDAILAHCADSLSAVDAEMRYLIKEYHDGLLLYEVSNRNVWEKASKDEVALDRYFKKNKNKYKWDEPRFKGMAYHVKTQADVKAVADCVKKLKFEDWNEALRKTFNNDSIIRIRVEKGLFKKGDSKLVDQREFKVADVKVDSVKGYPIDATYGKMLKKPETYQDVRGLVIADLQDELERQWVADLRKRYAFTVNEEVLRTVNKHGANE